MKPSLYRGKKTGIGYENCTALSLKEALTDKSRKAPYESCFILDEKSTDKFFAP
jgi:hypothetical protein